MKISKLPKWTAIEEVGKDGFSQDTKCSSQFEPYPI